MRCYIVCLALLIIAFGSPSSAQDDGEPASTTEAADTDRDVDQKTYIFDLGKLKSISLNCSSPDSKSPSFVWQKNGEDVGSVEYLNDRYEIEDDGTFVIKARATEDDFGNYTCYVEEKPVVEWLVHAKTIAKMPSDLSVVEGQGLNITCKLIGKPPAPVHWLYILDEETAVEAVLGDRVKVTDSAAGVPGGQLEIARVERTDAGNYTCVPLGGVPASTTVRVKGIYDALWPFLGICAEVLILCTVILVYEKRHNKPELDDSDADNHEQ